MTVALGIDIGTTGAQVVGVDGSGRVTASAAREYPLLTPRPGWTEQDPEVWWMAAQEAITSAARTISDDQDRIVGVGLTGQMHGSVFLDASGSVIRPALLWNDQRTAKQCEEITDRVGPDRLVAITGNPALTGFQAPKVLWLRDEEPDAFERLAHVLLPKDFIRLRLTGELATDASDASGTLFLDLRHRAWSDDVLDALEVPGSWLPTVREGPEATGMVQDDVAAGSGLPLRLPVAAGGGDNAAAAVGTAITRSGVMSSSIGTSGVLFAYADEPAIDPSGRIHAFCHAVPGAYSLLAVTLSAGGSLRWWREVTGAGYDALLEEAGRVLPGAEGLVFLPYLTGERTPHLDPEARGVFLGLTARHTRAHLTRALMEGVLFSLRDGLEIMRGLGIDPGEIRAIGGGAAAPLWLRLQADVFGRPVRRLQVEEGAAYGAALLGHVAAGTFGSVDEATGVVRTIEDVTEPDADATDTYDGLYGTYRELYPRLREDMHRLAELGGRS